MTIRQTLLVSFVLFGVVFAALMTALAYSRSRAALSAEIRLNLETQSLTLMQQVDAMLFERIKDMQEWQRLDVMQEVRVGDVDKRLARFLRDIKTAYAGVYTDILCVQDGHVVAASDAARIGATLEAPAPWIDIDTPGGAVSLARPQLDIAAPVLTLHGAIADAFTGQPLATLYADFDWRELTRLLSLAVANTGRYAVLVDNQGVALAATPGAGHLADGAVRALVAASLGAHARGVIGLEQAGPGRDDLLIGYARSTSYRGLPDLGWTLLVLTPEDVAFAAVHALLWRLLVLLAGIAGIAVVLATRLSARSARPIQELTTYARALGQDIDTAPRIIAGSAEIQELSHAFNRTMDELRRSREHLVRVSKLAAAGEMAAKLAHEVRTPLGIIRSSAQLIGRQDKLDAAGREMMSFMINECDRINELVTSLLDSARPRAPLLAPNDLNDIAHQVIDMLQGKFHERQVRLDFAPERSGAVANCDRHQMVQVALNLVMNALQVAARPGHVRVSTRHPGDAVELCVEDDGPGVPPDRRAAILEPFVSFRAGGLGLGLSVVREIVAMHGGTLQIDDSSLGGARFSVRLPAASS